MVALRIHNNVHQPIHLVILILLIPQREDLLNQIVSLRKVFLVRLQDLIVYQSCNNVLIFLLRSYSLLLFIVVRMSVHIESHSLRFLMFVYHIVFQ